MTNKGLSSDQSPVLAHPKKKKAESNDQLYVLVDSLQLGMHI